MHFIASIFAFLRRIVVILLSLAIIIFIASNREHVSLTFFPLPFTWNVPLYIPSFLMGAAGLIIGFLIAATPILPARFRSWRDTKKLQAEKDALAQELAILKLHGYGAQNSVLPYYAPAESQQLRPASELFGTSKSL
jgi:putative membrane protein